MPVSGARAYMPLGRVEDERQDARARRRVRVIKIINPAYMNRWQKHIAARIYLESRVNVRRIMTYYSPVESDPRSANSQNPGCPLMWRIKIPKRRGTSHARTPPIRTLVPDDHQVTFFERLASEFAASINLFSWQREVYADEMQKAPPTTLDISETGPWTSNQRSRIAQEILSKSNLYLYWLKRYFTLNLFYRLSDHNWDWH